MKLLEQRIRYEGEVFPGGILKVDSFLNHQIDPQLISEMAKELKRLFADAGVNKILTIEASGIALAVMAAAAVVTYGVDQLASGFVYLLTLIGG